MSKRLVTILWIIAGLCAAMVAFAKFGQSRNGNSPTALAPGARLLKDFPASQIATVKIENADSTATISKGADGKWTVTERQDYAANFPKLTRLILSLTESSVAQNMKGGIAYNQRFGMDSESENQEDHGYQLTFLDEDGKQLDALSLGKSTEVSGPGAASGKYVRLASEPQSIYTVTESFYEASADPTLWLNKEFFGISGIASIAMNPGEGNKIENWSLSRKNAESEFVVDNLPDGHEVQTDKLSPLESVLSAPQFEDVLTSEEAQARRDEGLARELTITTFDGFQYLINYAPEKAKEMEEGDLEEPDSANGDYIVQVTVSANLPEARVKREGESAEEAKQAEAGFQAHRTELQKKLSEEQTYNEHHYLVASYTFSQLDITLDDIAKAAEPELAPPLPQGPGPFRPAPQNGGNADALNSLSEEDIQRLVEQARQNQAGGQ